MKTKINKNENKKINLKQYVRTSFKLISNISCKIKWKSKQYW